MRLVGLAVLLCLLGCSPDLEERCKKFCESTRGCYTPVQEERCERECIVDLQDADGDCLDAFDVVIDCVTALPCDDRNDTSIECGQQQRKFEDACESTF